MDQQQQHPVIADLCFHLSKAPSSSSSTSTTTNDVTPSSPTKHKRSSIPLPVAAVRVLLNVIRRSHAETMMGLQADLRDASDVMLSFAKKGGPITSSPSSADASHETPSSSSTTYLLAGRSHIALSSGCELFLKYVTRASLETPNFTECKSQVLERGTKFAEFSLAARDRIAGVGSPFVREGSVVLTHGRSRVVEALLLRAALVEKKRFRVIVLEGRPDAGGAKSAKTYANAGIPTSVVLDSAMGYIMERVDLVIVGAEGVVENGGVVNKVGSFALGVMAKELGVPFYVAAESYKFTRLYPLNNADLPDMGGIVGGGLKFLDTLGWSANATSVGEQQQTAKQEDTTDTSLEPYVVKLPSEVTIENPPCDFTPAKYITLLFTDLGVLTPSAVSDELIRLYQ
jgi:translation initiation factor eIF-2B subunit alpha